MSYTQLNEITLYLRPVSRLPVYQIQNCAAWMVKKRLASSYKQALESLIWLMEYRPDYYKAYLSWYFEDTDYQPSYKFTYDINDKGIRILISNIKKLNRIKLKK